jgi:hypothetical protein
MVTRGKIGIQPQKVVISQRVWPTDLNDQGDETQMNPNISTSTNGHWNRTGHLGYMCGFYEPFLAG